MTEATALMQLQEIDIKLLRHAAKLAAMPQKKRLKTIDLAQHKVASELTKIVGKRKDLESDIADLTAARDHYRELSEKVKAEAAERQEGYRHIQDLEAQLTSLAKKTEKCEHDLGELEGELSRVQLAEKNGRLTQDRLSDARTLEQRSFDQDSAQLRAEILSLKEDRSAVAENISPELMATYEAARKRFKGLAVEVLNDNIPSTCRVKLQPSTYHDVMHGPDVTECPYCHRILIVRGIKKDGGAR